MHTIQTSIPWAGFEPTIPAFERVKTVHALDRAGTVIGSAVICFACISCRSSRIRIDASDSESKFSVMSIRCIQLTDVTDVSYVMLTEVHYILLGFASGSSALWVLRLSLLISKILLFLESFSCIFLVVEFHFGLLVHFISPSTIHQHFICRF
jgi:hypothetical protein